MTGDDADRDGVLEMEVSDERFTAWMQANLTRAAEHFHMKITRAPVLGWRLRSIGAVASGADGPRWLRVVSEYPRWACGDGWTGNQDSNALSGLTKPRLLNIAEWDDRGRRQRAEVLTLLPGHPVSATDVLHQGVNLAPSWWTALRHELDHLRAIPTRRVNADQDTVTRRSEAAFAVDLRIEEWESVHGDLHWANLFAPRMGILDWELWGRGPVGTDAASLYCHSLLVPAVADRVRDTFADVLDSPRGRTAQLAVAARMLGRIDGGDYPELEAPLRRLVAALNKSAARQ